MVFKNIKYKLLFYYFFSISIILAIFSALIIYLFYKQNIKTIESQLLVVAHEIDLHLDERYKKGFDDRFIIEKGFRIDNLYIHIYRFKDNRFLLLGANTKKEITPIYKKIAQKEYRFFGSPSDTNTRSVLLHSGSLKNFYIQVSTSIDDKVNRSIEKLFYTLFIVEPLILLVMMIVGYFMISKLFGSVKSVIDEVHEIDLHELDKRINRLDSDDEIAELVDTFNSLLDRIEGGVGKIKRFSNDVSHELKTPLTVLRGEIELGLRKDRSISEYKEVLKIALEETRSLQELIDGLLFLAHENDENLKQKFTKVNIDEILLEVLDEQKQFANRKKIDFTIKGISSVVSNGNELLLKIMLSNIIQNAIKYSHQRGKIDVALYDDGLSIKDYGIGIKKEELENIFDRFYRADSARTRDGFGLGLSMVINIITIHEFKIDVKSEYGKFTEVTILF